MNKLRYTEPRITQLTDSEVFVFGSNPEGRHGAGAAKMAQRFGARMGQGEGLMGQSYGLPTKELRSNYPQFTVIRVAARISRFMKVAAQNPEKVFLMTEIGCGLSVFTPKDIGPLFAEYNPFPTNVVLPKSFAVFVPQYATI